MTNIITPQSGTILIADDDSNLRMWLSHVLEVEGYRVYAAEDGQEALQLFDQIAPDMILLDAVMPTLDGFETCVQLRQRPGGENVPVLIITGLEGEEAVERAFEVGAIDYITKPIHWAVLRHRVRRLLQTKALEKLRDDLTQMIVHDMKNPITIIRGYAELLTSEDLAPEWQLDAIVRIKQSSNTLLNMTMTILDMGRLQEGKLTLKPTTGSTVHTLKLVKDSFSLHERDRHIEIVVDPNSADVTTELDWELLERVLGNLVDNAFKHSLSNSQITLSCTISEGQPNHIIFSVADHGEGIAPHEQKRIFEKFTQASLRKRGSRLDTGLGLTFCKLATEAHQGHIEVQSSLGAGAIFRIHIPYT